MWHHEERQGEPPGTVIQKTLPESGGLWKGLERLHADLEVEKNRTQRAHGHLCVELRHLWEEAEREQQRTVRELVSRHRCQTDRHSNRLWCLLAKEVNSEWHSKVESTGKEAFCLCSRETYTKLKLLLMLYEKIHGEQSGYKLHHRQEFELEKAIFLCHLLEDHRRPVQGRQRAGHPSYIYKSLSRKPAHEGSSNYREILKRAQSASHSFKNTRGEKRKQPSGKGPCNTVAVGDTCQSSSLKICHSFNTPYAGCSESCGSNESLPAKCMDRNMEVSCSIF